MLFITTEDGSPTIQLTNSHGISEKMHHFRGAYSESLYIYHTALTLIAQSGVRPEVLSLGLGLGYNEMIWAADNYQNGDSSKDSFLDSFEVREDLRDQFSNWIHRRSVRPEFANAYDCIADRVCDTFTWQKDSLRSRLAEMQTNKQLNLNSAFSLSKPPARCYNTIFYDAFSSKMDPHLWEEKQLQQFLEQCTQPKAVFTTYACTGSLKRALTSSGFKITLRDGFGGKRHSILATRGL